MAAPTITVDRYAELIFDPKSTAMKPDHANLSNMKFDSQHYERYYTLCRGAGGDHEKCKDIPVDEHITPQNPTVQHFQKQVFDGVDCMNDHGDINKCLHHTEYVAKKFEYEEPPKGQVGKVRDLLGRMGTSAWGIPAAVVARMFLKM